MATLAETFNVTQTQAAEQKVLSPGQLAWRKLRRNRAALFGLILLIALIAYIVIGSFVFSEQYANHNDLNIRLQAPSAAHPFGTDPIGRDILARTIYGGQISLLIGLTAVAISLVVGVLVGAFAGYYGGKLDGVLMRFTEAVLNIPSLFLLIIAAKYAGDKIRNFELFGREFSGSLIVIILIIGFTSWMYLARIVRSEFLSLKEREFVTAARALGVKNLRIIFRHVLPNTTAPIIVAATLGIATAILSEAYISFLGLGVRAPTATWGNMLEDATRYIENAPHIWFFPGLLILITVLAINFVGDGLRDALDPRTLA
ncbi:MAG: ABC transporter permease [Chloroflexi bacterium]|nr:ABC transporter permease [Chloroflexota bacterium]